MMTELEMSLSLGLVLETEKNRLKSDPQAKAEILYLQHIFAIQKIQRQEMGELNSENWLALIPWHSSN
jgi:hypothetical protein